MIFFSSFFFFVAGKVAGVVPGVGWPEAVDGGGAVGGKIRF